MESTRVQIVAHFINISHDWDKPRIISRKAIHVVKRNKSVLSQEEISERFVASVLFTYGECKKCTVFIMLS